MAEELDNQNEPTKDLTAGLSDRQLLELVLQRLDKLETRFDGRDTNPLPPNYDARFTALEEGLGQIQKSGRLTNHKLDALNASLLDLKADERDLAERVNELEKRAA